MYRLLHERKEIEQKLKSLRLELMSGSKSARKELDTCKLENICAFESNKIK